MSELDAVETDVLVVGAGGAGMFAALYAARAGADVILIDKNVVGRGGATIMAQMTCASALGEAEPDSPEQHLEDTLDAGRGLCNEALAAILCEGSPARIRELSEWKVDWARGQDGRINQVKAPGHSRKRCVYVDYLCTGAAICAALRLQVARAPAIRTINNLSITDVATRDGEAIGALGFGHASSTPTAIKAGAVVLCSGGMMKLFRRTTAPNNNAGEGAGMALRAGAKLIDMEFLQFYPNGHLAPRMVGLDPTTWEPTRVKLGGRLLNALGEEFLSQQGEAGGDGYNTTRDALTHAIYREVQSGRGAPHGGVYLSFQHIDPSVLEAALGPCMAIFKRNNIDLTKQPVEVFPIAHYQMGGVEVDIDMETGVRGLFAAGEIVGGANGANRLSGNALPEAMVFGARAGERAARSAARRRVGWDAAAARNHIDTMRRLQSGRKTQARSPMQAMSELKELMWTHLGAFREADSIAAARARIRELRIVELDQLSLSPESVHNADLADWFELRNGLCAAEAVALAAYNRRESRGAHQRNDFPQTSPEWAHNQRIAMSADEIVSNFEAA